MKTILPLNLTALRAQSTAFTYQGRLNDGGAPANGAYDLTFALYAVSHGTGQVGRNLTNAAPGFATLWWAPPTPGFARQSTDRLAPTNWVNAPSSTNNPATVPATLPARFFRLSKP